MTLQAELRCLDQASAPERTELRDTFVAWLQNPDHAPLQITGRLFSSLGPGEGCCAVGGLLTVLATAGYARIDPDGDGATVVLRNGAAQHQLVVLGENGTFLDERGADVLPDELAAALGLGLSLSQIAELNDGPCVPHAFWEIAEIALERQTPLL
ncbi:hypothetical protein DESA109040_02300 [Deinococcus saxicola]|uniref:hypothetical protein n=1 Tax=Deinococcus saxicola TaxID=249406 RepID=UPI0039F00819